MKKMLALGIVVLAISLGFTACGLKGGTLKLVNDESERYAFTIRFDGVTQKVNNGAVTIDPGQTIQAHSDEDTPFVVYSGANLLCKGTLSGGQTITKYFSKLPE